MSIYRILIVVLILVFGGQVSKAANPMLLAREVSELMDQGKDAEALAKAEEYIKTFPDVGVKAMSGMHFKAGFSALNISNIPKATEHFMKAYEMTDDEVLKPLAIYYAASANFSQGGSLEGDENEAKRMEFLKKAYELYAQYIEAYPQGDFTFDAKLEKAACLTQMGEMEKSLEEYLVLKEAGLPEDVQEDVGFTMAWIYTQLADKAKADIDEAKNQQFLQKARALYEELAQSDNIVFVNTVRFLLANLEIKAGNQEKAIKAFRGLSSKADTIEVQKQIIETAKQANNRAARSGNESLMRRASRRLSKETAKLKQIEESADPAIDALAQVALAYSQMGKFDEAAIVYSHAALFAQEEALKKDIRIQLIVMRSQQGLADEASRLFKEFQKDFPGDPLGESIDFNIANAMLSQAQKKNGEVDEAMVLQAIGKFDDFMSKNPTSKAAGFVPNRKAFAYQLIGKNEEAMRSYEEFFKSVDEGKVKVPKDVMDSTRFSMALLFFSLEKFEKALEALKELSDNAEDANLREEAMFRYAKALTILPGKGGEAADALARFAEQFPESPNAAEAIGLAAKQSIVGLDVQDSARVDSAITKFKKVIEKFPGTDAAFEAYQNIWLLLYKSKRFDEMVQAQDEMISAFPKHPGTLSALFQRAIAFHKQKASTVEEKAAIEQKALASYLALNEHYEKLKAAGVGLDDKTTTRVVSGLTRAADILSRQAAAMGPWTGFDDAQKKEWDSKKNQAMDLLASAVLLGRKGALVDHALKKYVEIQVERIKLGIVDMDKGIEPFSQLSASFTDDPGAKTRVLIAQATVPFELGRKGVAKSLLIDAFADAPADVEVSWDDLDRYGSVLLEDSKLDKANEVYSRLLNDFTADKLKASGMKPKIAEAVEKRSRAAATYGLGRIAFEKGDLTKADEYFTELAEKFAWSDKIAEADYIRGKAAVNNKELDKAFDLWAKVLVSPRATPALQARTTLAFAIELEKNPSYSGKQLQNPKGERLKNKDGSELKSTELALNYYRKISLLYGGADPAVSAEALYRGADILKNKGEKDEARQMLSTIMTDYPQTEWRAKAQDMLSSL